MGDAVLGKAGMVLIFETRDFGSGIGEFDAGMIAEMLDV